MPGPFDDFPRVGRRRNLPVDAGVPRDAGGAEAGAPSSPFENFPRVGKRNTDAVVQPKNDAHATAESSKPVAEPDVWDELAGQVTAFGQGVGLNVIDDLYAASAKIADYTGIGNAAASREGAKYVREATGKHPGAHLAGTILRSGVAAAAAPARLAAQALAGGLTGMAGEYGRSGDLGLSALAGTADAAMGAVGHAAGEVAGVAANAVRKRLPAWLGGGDEIARIGRNAKAPPEHVKMPQPSAPPPAGPPPPAPEPILDLANMKPPRAAPDDVQMLDDVELPSYPPSPLPSDPPTGTWPPDVGNPKLVQGKGGRFAKPVPIEIEPMLPPSRARGMDAPPEPPLETPHETMLRADGPLTEPGPMPTPSMSEPPLPIEPPTPSPYASAEFEAMGAPRMRTDYPPAQTGAPPPGKAWNALRSVVGFASPRTGRVMDMVKPPTGLPSPLESGSPAAASATRAGLQAPYQAARDYLLEKSSPTARAEGEAPVAYADQPTTNYAVSAVLSSGRSGLAPEDEAAITRAMVEGNEQQLRAHDFRLRMQNPAYARAVERELKSYQEQEW